MAHRVDDRRSHDDADRHLLRDRNLHRVRRDDREVVLAGSDRSWLLVVWASATMLTLVLVDPMGERQVLQSRDQRTSGGSAGVDFQDIQIVKVAKGDIAATAK